jgi:DNA-binding transcriptional regulator YiaG
MLEVHAAYKRKLGALVHRKHSAERSQSALAELYREERALREALVILTDPVRRSMYNTFRKASDGSLPSNPNDLWTEVQDTVVDKTTVAALRLLGSLTTLPLQEVSLLQAPAQKRNPEEEKTEPIGVRPASLKNRTQRADVRESITQVTDQRGPKLDLDATEIVSKPVSKAQKAPLETLKDRVPKTDAKSQSAKEPAPRKAKAAVPLQETAKPAKPALSTQDLVRQHGYSGRLFRAIRENQGLSVSELSQRTNVPVNYINAIENEDFGVFSGPFFVRGVVKNISRSLGIQERAIVEGFLSRMGF